MPVELVVFYNGAAGMPLSTNRIEDAALRSVEPMTDLVVIHADISSTPDAAEIQVDGAYVGDTPRISNLHAAGMTSASSSQDGNHRPEGCARRASKSTCMPNSKRSVRNSFFEEEATYSSPRATRYTPTELPNPALDEEFLKIRSKGTNSDTTQSPRHDFLKL
jgi:hypothetical protein